MTNSDKQILLELAEAVRNSGDAPTLEREFDPNDPEACEAVLYEADCAVGHFMDSPRWDGLRYRLSDPDLYDDMTLAYRVKVWKQLLAIIADAQGIIVQEEGLAGTMRHPNKGTCTHLFPDACLDHPEGCPETCGNAGSPGWNGCGNEGVYVESCEGVPQYRCSEHFGEWVDEQFRYALKEHKAIGRIVQRIENPDDFPEGLLERIENDPLA